LRIFISWSGRRSQAVAEALREWLPQLFQAVQPWISSADIRAGSRWAIEVAKALETTEFGILCVTKENLVAPWLLFEAGALSKSLSVARVVPFLLDLEPHGLTGPLAQFQALKADEAGTRRLIQCIAEQHDQNFRSEATLARVFAAFWPNLSSALKEIAERPAEPEISQQKTGLISAEVASQEDAEGIAESDPADIQFTEYEIRLSDSWPLFLEWLTKRTKSLEIVSIQEDKNRESTFCCSGKPGHMNYPIEVSCRKAGLPVTFRFDLVSEWLHPQILGLRAPDAGIPWDTSLFPVEKESEKESLIDHQNAKLRDAQYWVLFARRR
jgi:hypothetical protein